MAQVISPSRMSPEEVLDVLNRVMNSELLEWGLEEYYHGLEVRKEGGERKVVAGVDMKVGEVLLVERPIVVMHRPNVSDDATELNTYLHIGKLTAVYALANKDLELTSALDLLFDKGISDASLALCPDEVFDFLQQYIFQAGDTGETFILARVASLFSHSCEPNVNVNIDVGQHRYIVGILSRDVKKGDELTVGYTGLLHPELVRSSFLFDKYGFVCGCNRCGSERAGSDEKWKAFVRNNKKLWEDGLVSITPTFYKEAVAAASSCMSVAKHAITEVGYVVNQRSVVELVKALDDVSPGTNAIKHHLADLKNFVKRAIPQERIPILKLLNRYFALNGYERLKTTEDLELESDKSDESDEPWDRNWFQHSEKVWYGVEEKNAYSQEAAASPGDHPVQQAPEIFPIKNQGGDIKAGDMSTRGGDIDFSLTKTVEISPTKTRAGAALPAQESESSTKKSKPSSKQRRRHKKN